MMTYLYVQITKNGPFATENVETVTNKGKSKARAISAGNKQWSGLFR